MIREKKVFGGSTVDIYQDEDTTHYINEEKLLTVFIPNLTEIDEDIEVRNFIEIKFVKMECSLIKLLSALVTLKHWLNSKEEKHQLNLGWTYIEIFSTVEKQS